jgi:hypothetical protein
VKVNNKSFYSFCATLKVKPSLQSENGVDLAMIKTFLTIIHNTSLCHCKVNSILALMQRLGYLSRWRMQGIVNRSIESTTLKTINKHVNMINFSLLSCLVPRYKYLDEREKSVKRVAEPEVLPLSGCL